MIILKVRINSALVIQRSVNKGTAFLLFLVTQLDNITTDGKKGGIYK